jgi:nucleotide-binding universal stress UspA family protein
LGPLVSETAEALRATGLKTSIRIREGDPHRVLNEEAREWGADCIFVGPDGHSTEIDQRGQGGATVTSLAVNAPCSVEVAREPLWATAGAFIPLACVANNSASLGAG